MTWSIIFMSNLNILQLIKWGKKTVLQKRYNTKRGFKHYEESEIKNPTQLYNRKPINTHQIRIKKNYTENMKKKKSNCIEKIQSNILKKNLTELKLYIYIYNSIPTYQYTEFFLEREVSVIVWRCHHTYIYIPFKKMKLMCHHT